MVISTKGTITSHP